MGKSIAYYVLPHPPIVIPEVGRGEEQKILSTSNSMHKVAQDIAKLKPSTIIIISPHGTMFRDAISILSGNKIKGGLARFGVPGIDLEFEIDNEFADKIASNADGKGIPTIKIDHNVANDRGLVYELDHGAYVPLYFINKYYRDFKLVHINYGLLMGSSLYSFGGAISKAIVERDGDAVIIASGDMSHKLLDIGPYGYSSYGPRFDNLINDFLVKGDSEGIVNFDKKIAEEASECGLRSIQILVGALHGAPFRGELISYEGPFGVGYSVVELLPEPISEPVDLAKKSLIHYLSSKKILQIPDQTSKELTETKRGAFVSLKKNGELRGCIGTILATRDSLAEEIIYNALEAGLHDPRFNPITLDEIDSLDFSVDVLGEPESCNIDELDPKRFGVIVSCGRRRGLLLPDLEGVDSVAQQLSIALSKAGISSDEEYEIERFSVTRYR